MQSNINIRIERDVVVMIVW